MVSSVMALAKKHKLAVCAMLVHSCMVMLVASWLMAVGLYIAGTC